MLANLSPLTRSILSASIGALVYGSWAYYVNSDAGFAMGLTTAIVQGSFSFVLTLTLTLLIEHVQRRLGTTVPGVMATILIASGFMFSMAYGAQWSAGAPHVLMTILPGWVIGTIYAASYAITLRKKISLAG